MVISGIPSANLMTICKVWKHQAVVQYKLITIWGILMYQPQRQINLRLNWEQNPACICSISSFLLTVQLSYFSTSSLRWSFRYDLNVLESVILSENLSHFFFNPALNTLQVHYLPWNEDFLWPQNVWFTFNSFLIIFEYKRGNCYGLNCVLLNQYVEAISNPQFYWI